MKQLLLFFGLCLAAIQAGATELHTGNIILTFPCLAKGPVQKGDTEVYSGNTTQVNFELQTIKTAELKDYSDCNKAYEDFLQLYLSKNKATQVKKEERTVNGKKVKYFSCTFLKDKVEYLSESVLYGEGNKMYHLNSIKKNDHIKVAEVEIFFNSLIIIK